MSKNIVIQEGGVARQLTVDKLKTNLVGGGMQLWVPEDEVQLTTKTITENGTYKASDDGSYGYSQVFVNVAGGSGGSPGGPGSSIVGKDGDGDEAVVSVDGDGDIHSTKIPSSIQVITPPTNPYGIYMNGATISKDGMVIRAYLETGGEYGTVPNGEVTLNPTTAVYDPDTTIANGTATLDGNTLTFAASASMDVTVPGELTPYGSGMHDNTYYMYNFDPGFMFLNINGDLYLFGPSNRIYYTRKWMNGLVWQEDQNSWLNLLRIECDPSSAGGYFYSSSIGFGADEVISGMVPDNNTTLTLAQIATVLKNGETQVEPLGSRQQITVSWPRPGDGKVLETTFEILVAPPIYGGGDS